MTSAGGRSAESDASPAGRDLSPLLQALLAGPQAFELF